jgi:Outer membrane protein beta-barrel domain
MSITRFVVAAALCVPMSLFAQVKLEVTPYFTSYYATNELRFLDANNLERQEAAPGIGAALTWRFNNIWAIEGSASYIRSGVVVKDTSFVNFEPATEGYLLMSNVRILFQPRRTNIYFALGAGNTSRGGAAFDVPGLDDKSDMSGIVGFGVRSRVSPQWGFRIGAEMHVYRTNIDGDNAYYPEKTQRDVLVTIGVPFALVGR